MLHVWIGKLYKFQMPDSLRTALAIRLRRNVLYQQQDLRLLRQPPPTKLQAQHHRITNK
jgi:hypothetical protein